MKNGSIMKLYEIFLDNQEVSEEKLKKLGFGKEELMRFTERKLLKLVRSGYYSYVDTKELFQYGMVLKSLKRYDQAILCFKKCYELDPTNQKVCFQLFFESIGNKDYSMAMEYMQGFYDQKDFMQQTNNKLYLYLLSFLTTLPDDLKESAKSLKIHDIKLKQENKKIRNLEIQNQIRSAIFEQKWKYALKQLNDFIPLQKIAMTHDVLLKRLLIEIIEYQKERRKKILEWILNDQIEVLVYYLEQEKQNHRFCKEDEDLLTVSQYLVIIKQNLSIKAKTMKDHVTNFKENPLYLLLQEIRMIQNMGSDSIENLNFQKKTYVRQNNRKKDKNVL